MNHLEQVLKGASQKDRERIIALFNGMLSGDPNSFPMQLALITRANIEALAFYAGRLDGVKTELSQGFQDALAELAKNQTLTLTPAAIESIGKRAGEGIKVPSLKGIEEHEKRMVNSVLRIEKVTASAIDTRAAVAALPKVLKSYQIRSMVVAFVSAFMFAGILAGLVYWQARPRSMVVLQKMEDRGGGLRFDSQKDSFVLSGPFTEITQDPQTGAIRFKIK